MFVLPRGPIAALQPLEDLVSPKLHLSNGEVEDFSIDTSSMEAFKGKSLDDWASVAFGIVNATPKRRRTFITATSSLRMDHIAVMKYSTALRSGKQRAYVLTSKMFADRKAAQVRTLGLDMFLQVGMRALKRSVMCAAAMEESLYHFS